MNSTVKSKKQIMAPKGAQKSFFGDLIGSIVRPLGTVVGGLSSAVGIPAPIGASIGSFLGNQVGGLAERNLRKGGKVKKGTKQAKVKMARVRAMKRK